MAEFIFRNLVEDDHNRIRVRVNTTEMGIDRIKKNLKLDTDDVVEYCKNKVLDKNIQFDVRGFFQSNISMLEKTIPLLKIYDDTYIEETHNISKLDSPSGTSIQLKENFNKDIKIFSKRKKH